MISAANPLASEAGREILRAGGSAVDAAIAAQMVLTLVEPQSSGIGGGAFLMHFHGKDGKVEAYDGRETAPAAIRPDVFLTADGKRRAFRAAGDTDVFYAGPIATDIAKAVRTAPRNPAKMTVADIQAYAAKKREPVCRPYRTYRVCGMPPPTSGGLTTLQILGLLESFDMARIPPGSVNAVHLISEASRLAYADRGRYIGDPDFVSVPVKGMLENSYLRRRAGRISATGSMGKALPGRPPGPDRAEYATDDRDGYPSTSHLSVIDGAGNAVSMTTSIERAFGSRLMVRGFLLNNQLTDFAYLPRRNGLPVANAVAPGKRPRSSMSPTLVFDEDGDLFATVGSPGGSRIIAYVTKTLIGLIDWKLGMQAAIDLPTHVNRNGTTELEKGTPLEERADGLRRLGHDVKIRTLTSGLHGIRVTPYGYDGGADRRREGEALGD
ncbi:MAG: gamma-glutamyltransferase family protein [Alphaproteobacteria bacterium]|nr:gamma-glutamyltransferase family protein [Alphaproteobacteria bacterium]